MFERGKYHYLIDKDGNVHNGIHRPEDNLNCKDGNYAPHTAEWNTGSIGIAFCGMAGFLNKKQVGDYPLTKKQIEAGFKLAAELVHADNISIHQIYTHYEVGLMKPHTENRGKIDIIYLPPYPEIKTSEVGNFIRSKVSWYYENRKEQL
jgi:N-acetyl-anhydromuramyl-L-alanine amidase AmpD